MVLDNTDKDILSIVADLHEIPQGAYNIRKNGASLGRASSSNITIDSDPNKGGLVITVKKGTKNESVHIPVILSQSGLTDIVRNEFIIGEDCDITIVAGCGIHNGGDSVATHSGVHTFDIGKNSRVKYIEKHYGEGKIDGNIMNPTTEVVLKEKAIFEMETTQIGGIKSSHRITSAEIGDGAVLQVNEKLLTEFDQNVTTEFCANLDGENSSAHIVSRAVARGESLQKFKSTLNGRSKCFGHTECDCIVMDSANVLASPEVNAYSTDASLIHEAAIGKIAGEQIVKLMTLGISEEDAQKQIIRGFLR